MRSLEIRIDRLEAVHRRPAAMLSAAEQAEITEGVRRLLGLVPPGADPEVIFRKMLRRVDSGFATDKDAVGGVNIEILRIVSSVHSSV